MSTEAEAPSCNATRVAQLEFALKLNNDALHIVLGQLDEAIEAIEAAEGTTANASLTTALNRITRSQWAARTCIKSNTFDLYPEQTTE